MLVGELVAEEVAEEVEEIVENVILVGSSGIPAEIVVVAKDHMDMVVAVVVVVVVMVEEVVEGEDQGQGLDHMNSSVKGGGDLDRGLIVDLTRVAGPETDHIVTPVETAEIALVIIVPSPRKKSNVVHNPMIDQMWNKEIKGLLHVQGQDHLVKMAMNNIVIDTVILTVITK